MTGCQNHSAFQQKHWDIKYYLLLQELKGQYLSEKTVMSSCVLRDYPSIPQITIMGWAQSCFSYLAKCCSITRKDGAVTKPDNSSRGFIISIFCLHPWLVVSRNEVVVLVPLFKQPESIPSYRSLCIWLPLGGRNVQIKRQAKGEDGLLEDFPTILHLNRDEAMQHTSVLDIASWMNKSKGLQESRLTWHTLLFGVLIPFLPCQLVPGIQATQEILHDVFTAKSLGTTPVSFFYPGSRAAWPCFFQVRHQRVFFQKQHSAEALLCGRLGGTKSEEVAPPWVPASSGLTISPVTTVRFPLDSFQAFAVHYALMQLIKLG